VILCSRDTVDFAWQRATCAVVTVAMNGVRWIWKSLRLGGVLVFRESLTGASSTRAGHASPKSR
jgi:hypothetical protein